MARAGAHYFPFVLPACMRRTNTSGCQSVRRSYTDFASATQINRDRDVLHARCTVLRMPDATTVHLERIGPLSKLKLCRENGIQPRDLRSLDTDIRDQPSSILVRNGSIIFCLPSLRAIIKPDKLLLLEPLQEVEEDRSAEQTQAKEAKEAKIETSQAKGDLKPSKSVASIVDDIRRLSVRDKASSSMAQKLDEGQPEGSEAPFEFLALEALLSFALQGLSRTSSDVTERVGALLRAMSSSEVISTNQLQELVEVKDAAEVFVRQAKELKDALDDILSEPTDMRNMYLTEITQGKMRESGDDDEIELLLEANVKHASSLASTASQNISRLNAASSHINLLLSSTRNRLLHLEIRVAIYTLAFSSGGIIASIFGMNLLNGFEEHPMAFYWVSAGVVTLSFLFLRAGRRALSHARRLKTNQVGMLGGDKRSIGRF